jgi:alkylation response protein AidB-like acyl-CoA dehydrogenase
MGETRGVTFVETEEHGLLRDAVRGIGEHFGARWWTDRARLGEKADEIWKSLSDHGFVGVNIPEEHGGGGQGLTELAIVTEELAACGIPLLAFLVSPGLCTSVLLRHGSPEQHAEFLPALASGDAKMAFAITEPDAGSNSHRIGTTATRDGDLYRLRGTKYYISAVDEARWLMVVTRTGTDPVSGRGRLSIFVVDTDTPGLERQLLPVDVLSPEKQFTLFFDDCEVPAGRLVGDEHEGLRVVFAGLNPERILSAAIATGIGRYSLRKAAAYARERRVWDVPIGTHQAVAHPLAAAAVDIELARLMNQKACWLYDSGLDAGEASNMAKYAGAEAGLAALDAAIQTHGGNGLAQEYDLAAYWGVARLLRTAPVSREMILNFVSTHTLGLPKSY